jgi:hypothetical protein
MWIAFSAIAWPRPGCSAALALQMLLYSVRPERARGFDSPEQVVLLIELARLPSTSARTGRDEGRKKLREEKPSNGNGFCNSVNRAG